MNDAVLLEQHRGHCDGHAQHHGGRAHPAAARRVKKGEVNLDLKEKHIYYDKERDVIEIPDEKPSFSRGLIEQFMVTANETVATFLNSRGAPCLYRVHEPPVPEKAENLKAFARLLGFSPKWNATH